MREFGTRIDSPFSVRLERVREVSLLVATFSPRFTRVEEERRVKCLLCEVLVKFRPGLGVQVSQYVSFFFYVQ